MIRALFKLVLVVVVLVGVGGFLLGWWTTTHERSEPAASEPRGSVDTDRAREIGADVGERAASAATQAREAVDDGSLTAKIKSKMALDDTVKALNIDVDTTRGVVTLSGMVASDAERKRAVQLARETEGVTTVRDQLQVR
jgi:hyperosmotically inducible periplasmic protein